MKMLHAARQFERSALDVEKAKTDSQRLWRALMIALGNFREDEPAEAATTPAALDLGFPGRYLAGDASEFDCVFTSISASGLRIEGPWKVTEGAWCVANLAEIGIVEGLALDTAPTSFRLAVLAPEWRIQRLAQRFAWRIRRSSEPVEERRKSERIEGRHAKAALATPDGRRADCTIFDISEGGAALHLGAEALYFWIDQPVTLDDRPGRVLRYFPGGLVIKFDEAPAPDEAD